jgi:malonyl CoA-acyl carrier protein transacylase
VNFDHRRAVVVFPGQPSPEVGVQELIEEWRPQLFETLSEALDQDDPFAQRHVSQAAEQAITVACSLAYWYAQGCPTPRYMLGHSLGELTALAAARSISEEDAVRLAARRGELMQRASYANAGCGMVAVRAPLFDIEAIAGECGLAVAFHTAPRQVVVAGTRDGLERARAAYDDIGIRCTDLDLPGAFNSPLMEPAVAPFRAALEECEVSPPQAIVYSAATCRPLIDVRAELAQSLVAPVRWWETLARLAMEGIETFVEISVGGLLSPLPAGIVTGRAPRPPVVAPGAVGPVLVQAAPTDAEPAVDPVFAYFDDENRLHVLI